MTGWEVEVSQIAPGRYQGNFPAEEPGAYLIQVQGLLNGDSVGEVSNSFGWVRPYGAEYWGPDPGSTSGLFHLLGSGARETPDPPWHPFTHDISGSAAITDVWPWLVAVAGFLLPLDIAVRRLALPSLKLGERTRSLMNSLRRPRGIDQRDPVRAGQLKALAEAKARAQSSKEASEDAVSSGGSESQPTTIPTQPNQVPDSGPADDGLEEEPGKDPETQEDSLAGALLASKRKRNKKR